MARLTARARSGSFSLSEKSPATITDIAGRANVKARPMANAPANSQLMVSAPLNFNAARVAAIAVDATWVTISARQFPIRCVRTAAHGPSSSGLLN